MRSIIHLVDKVRGKMYKTKATKVAKKWNVRLTVTSEEEKQIKKEAIDNEMKVSDYIKLKVLGNSPMSTQGKSS